MSIDTDIVVENTFYASGSGNTATINITGVSSGSGVVISCVAAGSSFLTETPPSGWDFIPVSKEQRSGVTKIGFFKVADGTETTVDIDTSASGGSWYLAAIEVSGNLQMSVGLTSLRGSGRYVSGSYSYLPLVQHLNQTQGGIILGHTAAATTESFTGTIDYLSASTEDRYSDPTANLQQDQTGLIAAFAYSKHQGDEDDNRNDVAEARLPLSGVINGTTQMFQANFFWYYDPYMNMSDNMSQGSALNGGIDITSGTLLEATVGKVYFYVKTTASAPTGAAMESGSGADYHGSESFTNATSATHNIAPTANLIGGQNYYAHSMHYAYGAPGQVRNVPFTWPGRTAQGTTEALTLTESQATVTKELHPIQWVSVTPSSFNHGTANIIAEFIVQGSGDLTNARLFIGRHEQTITSRTATTLTFTCNAPGVSAGANELQVSYYVGV